MRKLVYTHYIVCREFFSRRSGALRFPAPLPRTDSSHGCNGELNRTPFSWTLPSSARQGGDCPLPPCGDVGHCESLAFFSLSGELDTSHEDCQFPAARLFCRPGASFLWTVNSCFQRTYFPAFWTDVSRKGVCPPTLTFFPQRRFKPSGLFLVLRSVPPKLYNICTFPRGYTQVLTHFPR